MSYDESDCCPRLPDGKLLEGIVTTVDIDGLPHVAPMGPIVNADFSRLLLRPFCTSNTYQNLKRTGEGVLHVTDDVDLFARAAVGDLKERPRTFEAKAVRGVILEGACRWYAFRVVSIDDRHERTEIVAKVVDRGRMRDFFGFNRAKHAVIEAAILATRIEFLDAQHIRDEFQRLASPVTKTGGHEELAAFEFLKQYVENELPPKAGQGAAER
jgi:hypothetical protein